MLMCVVYITTVMTNDRKQTIFCTVVVQQDSIRPVTLKVNTKIAAQQNMTV